MNLIARIGRLPARAFIWGLAALFSLGIVLDALVLGGATGLARATYDAMVRSRIVARAPDARIVVVDIDEESLARMAPAFGRWPWPRDTLATVLHHLENRQPAAIAWDILFADPDALNPGGDAAFSAAAARSTRSHFAVVRLGAEQDGQSRINHAALPGLWATPGRGSATVAMIPPALQGVTAGKLGYNNSYPDSDGVVRRYRFAETLADGGILHSTALSVARAVEPAAADAVLQRLQSALYPNDSLLAWRRDALAYPRVPFWKLFEEAEGGAPAGTDWAGKVVLIGSTAPSLHDVHPSPLDRAHPGVFILANAIDNALHGEQLGELPRPVLAALGVAMCVGLALWAQFRSVTSLEPLVFVLPALLLAVSYLTLHGTPIFLELQVAAGLALTMLLALRLWNELRRQYWCSAPLPEGDTAVWPLVRPRAWSAAAIDRLMDVLERHAPQCRILVGDASPRWLAGPRWPEMAQFAAIVGPSAAVEASRQALTEPLRKVVAQHLPEPRQAPAGADRAQITRLCLRLWADSQAAAQAAKG